MDGKAHKTRSTFRDTCAVTTTVHAPASRIWSLLTDAEGFPRWNSTVEGIEGPIAAGRRLALRVPAAPGRVFRPTVTDFVPERRMVWSDGMPGLFRGVRTFTLVPEGDRTRFEMVEVFSGLMLPMARGSLPDFAPVFETYAADLRRAAEGS